MMSLTKLAYKKREHSAMNSIIKDLAKMVFNENETRVYYFLLNNNNSRAREISLASGVAKIETIEILISLMLKGFCFVRYFRSDIIYSIIDPEIAFIDVIAKHEENLLEKELLVEDLHKIYNNGMSRYYEV